MDYSDNEDQENDMLGPEDLFVDECSEDSEKSDGINKNKEKKKGKKEGIKEKVKEVKNKKSKSSRVKLNLDTLMGPHGLKALKEAFENFTFKGVNHEKEDLTRIMKILQNWMNYKLFPSGTFESTLAQLEALGHKKNVQTYMKKIRMGIDEWGETKSKNNENVDEINLDEEEVQKNNFDQWLNHQMEIVNTDDDLSDSEVPQNINQPNSQTSISVVTNEPQTSQNEPEITLTQEQLERIARNKKLAEERRFQRLSTLESGTETNKSLPIS